MKQHQKDGKPVIHTYKPNSVLF